jgi:outer membrane protein assembly factor BamA
MNSYDILSTNITNNSAIVKVKIISPNVEELTTRMLSEVMKQLKNTIDNGETIEEDTGKVAEEYYYKMLDDPNVEKITSEVNVDLVREGDKWLIKGNKEFKNAITGNMSRAASN